MKMVKTKIVCFIAAVSIGISAHSQDAENFKFRYPQRIVGMGERSVQLLPLFQWWVCAERSQTNLMATNALRPKPMPMWCHVTGKTKAETQSGWVVDAQIEYQPGKQFAQTVFLRSPPNQELHTFQLLVSRRDSLANAADRMAESAHDYRQQASKLSMLANAFSLYDPGFYASSEWMSQSAMNADSRADTITTRSSEAGGDERQAAKALAAFPFQSEYLVDLFAECNFTMDSGYQVYDAGLVFH